VRGWLQNNTAPNAVIMSRQPEVAYQARRRWVAFPHAPYPDCLDYARDRRVDYWNFRNGRRSDGKSHMIPVVEGRGERRNWRKFIESNCLPRKSTRFTACARNPLPPGRSVCLGVPCASSQPNHIPYSLILYNRER
jgi:hypothetical protein